MGYINKLLSLRLFGFIYACFILIPQLYTSQKSISIDFSKKNQRKESIVGFLHFNDLDPLEQNIKTLKPKFWRVGNALHDAKKRKIQIAKLHSYNITPILVITDFFAGIEDDWGAPFQKKEKFKDLVKGLYLENGNNVIYDIWNEPNTDSWKGSRTDFFETFKIAHDVIRSLPNGKHATITGPGFSRFEEDYLKEFLEFCSNNNLKVNILNWHEGGIFDDVLNVQNNINTAKALISKNPKVEISKIFIPEILWHTEQFNPSAVLSYLYIIEKNGASGACKTCWDLPQEDGGNTCWNNSIDGLLDPKGNTRSVWWAYKYYAESVDRRLSSYSNDEKIINISYLNSSSNVVILLTNLYKSGINNLSIDLKNYNRTVFQKNKNYYFKVFEIVNTQEKKSEKLKLISTKKINFKGNNKSFNVNNIDYNKMYYMIITDVK